ncbi:hypothetical protein EYR40_011103 [Pleurotus pulmonarius]|nr:hypothetical protein EYR36_002872 [Pleurotus pulmonarius]KAF4587082.1 hypothetical protein EYR40_011103 [Pleurotus pulmonarius]
MKFVAPGFVLLSMSLAAFAAVPLYGQCGGNGFTGETTCVSGATCSFQNEWYSQCVPSGAATSSVPVTSISSSSSTRSTTPTVSTSAGPAPTGTVPLNGLIGYGAGTTGGGNATPQTVTSCSALAAAVALEVPAVIYISGSLSGCDIIDIEADKTIIGVGSNSGLTNGSGFRIRRTGNVIIRNLKFHVSPEKKDLLSLDNATRVWVDHCEFSSIGMVGDKDTYDGLLDISHASDFVTVSWCKFSDHWKGSLIGHSDNNASEDTGKLHVTYHHNSFVNVNSRLPSVRFGTVHVFNSVYNDIPTSGTHSLASICVYEDDTDVGQLSQPSTPAWALSSLSKTTSSTVRFMLHSDLIHAELIVIPLLADVNLAVVTDLDSDLEGYAIERGNVFSGTSTTRITQVGSLSPPYSYSLDSTANLESIVANGAGVGKISV